jgi:hypothetical protein
MPISPGGDLQALFGARFVVGQMLTNVARAITSGMLAVVGVIALLLLLKRKWAAHLASSAIYVWVVISGMFTPGTPALDVAIGLGIIAIWTGVILYAGLLATVAALATHFILLRAPITIQFASWRGTPAITYILVLGAVACGAAFFAARSAPKAARSREMVAVG